MAEVTTVGTGEVERTADRASLQVAYVAQAPTRAEATARLAESIPDVERLLDAEGVEVRSRRLGVHDLWNGKRRTGAEARQAYGLRITDLAVLDDLLAALVASEPNTLDGPYWELADQEEPAREARRDAVADARRRAEDYAEAMGMRLGSLRELSDGSGHMGRARALSHRMPMAAYGAPAEAAAVQVRALNLEPELIQVTATCTISWDLLG